MLRRLNRKIKYYLRPKRLAIVKWIWDRKKEGFNEFFYENKLDMKKVKSILFLRYEGKIGDMVISTSIFREIKKNFPDIKIGVVSRGAAKDIIKFNPNVDVIYDYVKGKESRLAKEIAEENYDVLVDFSEILRFKPLKFIKKCKVKMNVGLEKEEWKLFDISYHKERGKHVSYTYENLLKVFGVCSPDLSYDIFVEDKIKENVTKKIEGIGRFIVINPYAASKHRCFSKDKVIEIVRECLKKFDAAIVILGEKARKKEIEDFLEIFNNKKVIYLELDGILEVVELIGKAEYLITPDTSIVHIGVAKNTPLTAIYRTDKEDDLNSSVWGPNSRGAKQIFSEDRTSKSGEESDINSFDVKKLF